MTSQKQSQVTNEILHGNLVKLMFKLTTPGILGMLLIGINTFLDALFAGQLIGKTAVAGISLALPIISIMGGAAYLVGVGSASVLSRAIGSGDIKIQSKLFGNLVILSVVISLVITVVGYIFGEQLIALMGGSGEVASAGAEYFKTYVLGSVFFIIGVASSQLIKAEGRIRLAMIFAAIFVIVNIILVPIFILVFHQGVQGIAFATVIAMVVYSIINFTYFISGKSSIPVHPKKFVLAIDLLTDILSVGMPSLLFTVMSLVQSFVTFKSISYYGSQNDIAFFGATLSLTGLALIPLNGFTQALQPVIGINYGAKNYDRIKKAYLTFVIGGTVCLTLFWLPLQLYPETFLKLLLPDVIFNKNDLLNFRILSLLIPLMQFIPFFSTLFQSLGKGKIISKIILLKNLILYIPFVVIFSKMMGVNGIYYGMVLTDFIIILIVGRLTVVEFEHFSKMQLKKNQT